MNFFQELAERGLIQDCTPGVEQLINGPSIAAYIGFDPTAESLHVGNLLPITLLMRLQKAGHKPYALVGGATGMIGDPSGKSAERNLLAADDLYKNISGIKNQLARFLDFSETALNSAVLVNNYDWFQTFSFLDFIRDVGKFITINYMMSKDSVQKRLETGLSFTEFSYQLIQGYDFFHLYHNCGVRLQMGGADQWGNILTGTELIRKKSGAEAQALTSPLITKADGTKFGKSEGGNIWLDRNRTSPYQFYQFWLRLSDEDAQRMAFVFSFRSIDEIKSSIEQHLENPGMRTLQKELAEEMTVLVHSREDLLFAQQASQILFGKSTLELLQSLSENQLLEIMDGVSQIELPISSLQNIDVVTFLSDNKIFPSKGEARKMIQNNGLSINKEKLTDSMTMMESFKLLSNKYLLVQKGKSNYSLLVFK